MNKLLAALLVVVILASGTVAGLMFQQRDAAVRERDEARAQIKAVQTRVTELETSTASLRKERDDAVQKADHATTEVKALQTKLTAATDAAKASAPGAGKPGSGPGGKSPALGAPSKVSPFGNLAEMMKNPAMREMVKQQQLSMLDMQYGKLFDHFQLDDKEKENFRALLAQRVQIETDAGLEMLDDKLTPQQRKDLTAKMDKEKKANDDAIRTFLNSDEDYQTYHSWEETKAERMQLPIYQGAISSAGEPLSPQQEQQLVDALYKSRTSPATGLDYSKPGNFDPSNTDQMMKVLDAKAAQVLKEAAAFLTPKQLQAFEQAQKQQRAMQEAGIKMSAQMFGGKNK